MSMLQKNKNSNKSSFLPAAFSFGKKSPVQEPASAPLKVSKHSIRPIPVPPPVPRKDPKPKFTTPFSSLPALLPSMSTSSRTKDHASTSQAKLPSTSKQPIPLARPAPTLPLPPTPSTSSSRPSQSTQGIQLKHIRSSSAQLLSPPPHQSGLSSALTKPLNHATSSKSTLPPIPPPQVPDKSPTVLDSRSRSPPIKKHSSRPSQELSTRVPASPPPSSFPAKYQTIGKASGAQVKQASDATPAREPERRRRSATVPQARPSLPTAASQPANNPSPPATQRERPGPYGPTLSSATKRELSFVAIPSRPKVASPTSVRPPIQTKPTPVLRSSLTSGTAPKTPTPRQTPSPFSMSRDAGSSRSTPDVNHRSSPTKATEIRASAKLHKSSRPNLVPIKISRPRPLRGGGASPERQLLSSSPETVSSSPSPVTPGPSALFSPSTLSIPPSDDEKSSKGRHFRDLFRRKRAGSFGSSLGSPFTFSASSVSSPIPKDILPPLPPPKIPEKSAARYLDVSPDAFQPLGVETLYGIKRHTFPIDQVPYPLSYEEMVLQGEKHTQDLLATIMNHRFVRFTAIDNLSKLRNVLDLGCGRGFWMTDAVKELKNAKVTGLDLVDVFPSSSEMRERRGLNEGQIARIEFIKGNFLQALPFDDGTFDFIRLGFVEMAIPESKWSHVLQEALRVLKPGGHVEIIIESNLFPCSSDYERQSVQSQLEEEFRSLLEQRGICPTEEIGGKMFCDPFVQVQTHRHVSVSIAPRGRGKGRRSTDTARSASSGRGQRESYSGRRSEGNALPPAGQTVTSDMHELNGIIVAPDTYIPTTDDDLFNFANRSALVLNGTRHASFRKPSAVVESADEDWECHLDRYLEYERGMRRRLGFKTNQFDDDDDDFGAQPRVAGLGGRWKWARGEYEPRPLEIRRFRAWTLSKPLVSFR